MGGEGTLGTGETLFLGRGRMAEVGGEAEEQRHSAEEGWNREG